MDASLRRLVEPAKTSPTDPFQWKDKRSKSQQFVNGIRIAGGLIGGFAVIMAVILGLSRLGLGQTAQNENSIFVSWAALIAAALIMLGTAHRWAPFVTIFFGPALLKTLGVLMVGDDSYYSVHSITRTNVVEFLAYAVTVVALTSRFIGQKPTMTTVFDRVALTFFVFATCEQWVIPYRFPPWPLLSGVVALFIGWCAHRLTRAKPTAHS